MALTWYTRLTPNSVETWKDLEILFHEGFYKAPPDVTLDDVARISQLPSESVEKYIGRFRNLRMWCSTKMSEADCVPMVEKEQRRGASSVTYYKDQLDIAVVSDNEDRSSEDEIKMAEFLGSKPLKCSDLRKTGFVKKNKTAVVQREYSFDLTKADEIFDALFKDGQIALSEGHVIPLPENMKAINEGKLLFPTKKEADAKYVSINTVRPHFDSFLKQRQIQSK
ncbi:uncharacterized protein LOC126669195 [Mercurialis annua]|uniref:uncharacterized protein LOC126669195 n=1 Tax=Mercurialis annua TaxID=3986 RepID=UPI00215F6B81|nr:uncharacterized protein LOC126669195 [Mercurialis annua]